MIEPSERTETFPELGLPGQTVAIRSVRNRPIHGLSLSKLSISVLWLAVLAPTILSLSAGCSGEPLPMGDETRVLVVARRSDPESYKIAVRYAEARRVAPSHVVFLDVPRTEEVTRDTYESRILAPLVDWWNRTERNERPDYVVLIHGLPHKIYGSGELTGTRASVDSELCFLPTAAMSAPPPIQGRRLNPYGRGADEEFPAFSHQRYGICLVTRIDGFTVDDALTLIDRSIAGSSLTPDGAKGGRIDERIGGRIGERIGEQIGERIEEPRGERSRSLQSETRARVLLDENGTTSVGNRWLRAAAERLREPPRVNLSPMAGTDAEPTSPQSPWFSVELESTGTFVSERDRLLGYAGWGSNDPAFRRDFRFEWVPGALVTTFVSSSARTFHEPPSGWTTGPAAEGTAFEGSTQSLSADWVRSGATGVAGNAYEPYLDACPRPQILFPAYLSGRNLAESYYLALPYLSWQSVILGDPLCSPFGPGRPSLSDEDVRRIVPNPARVSPGS
ncbi:MAG: TIGR03790 family protein [Candidatus Eisenbacteria bacterium]|uniref:TIGR03790 family protein n=1 Tax=Eiseniibacteriota bacterium TaxID=2212470 RepID=A0A956SFB8_UNCEI|nr:TIGR03790 family protein [Candidatus Eisenbacteria bacterium]